MCICVCVYLSHMWRALDRLELALQVAVSLLVYVMGTEL